MRVSCAGFFFPLENFGFIASKRLVTESSNSKNFVFFWFFLVVGRVFDLLK